MKDINPLVKINSIDLEPAKDNLKTYDIVVTSTKSFKEMEEWDLITKE